MKGVLLPNLQRDEMKDDSPFRHSLVGYKHTIASGLRFCDHYTKKVLIMVNRQSDFYKC